MCVASDFNFIWNGNPAKAAKFDAWSIGHGEKPYENLLIGTNQNYGFEMFWSFLAA